MLLDEGIVFDKNIVFKASEYSNTVEIDQLDSLIKIYYPLCNTDEIKQDVLSHANVSGNVGDSYEQEKVVFSVKKNVFFCPKCHCMHDEMECLKPYGKEVFKRISVEIDYFNYYDDNKNEQKRVKLCIGKNSSILEKCKRINELLFKCPSCGHEWALKDIEDISYKKTQFFKGLFYHSYHFYKEEDKFIISMIAKKYIPLPKSKKITAKTINFRYIFNLKTRQSYTMRPVLIGKDESFRKTMANVFAKYPRLQNITYNVEETYSSLHLSEKEFGQMETALTNAFYQVTGYRIPLADTEVFQYAKYADISRLISKILYYNNFQNLRPETIEAIENFKPSKKEMKQCKMAIMGNEKMRKMYLRKYKGELLEYKSIRRMVYEIPFTIKYLVYIEKCGFTDVNVIRNILKNPKICFFLRDICAKDISILKEYLVKDGDLAVFKVISSYKSQYIRDISQLFYYDIYNSSRLKQIILEDVKEMSVMDLHDKYTLKYQKVRRMVRVLDECIQYKTKELFANMDIGDYHFRLAKDTAELNDVGITMNICVGIYGRNACKKNCNIVVVRNNNKSVACIEYKDDVLRQFKGKYNRLPDKNVVEAFKMFYKEMKFKKCEEKLLDNFSENTDDALHADMKLQLQHAKKEKGYLTVKEYDEEKHPIEKPENAIQADDEFSRILMEFMQT